MKSEENWYYDIKLQGQGNHDTPSAVTMRYAIDHVESIKDASIGFAHVVRDRKINKSNLQGQGNHDTSSAITIRYAIDHVESIKDASLRFVHEIFIRNARTVFCAQ